MDEPAAATAGPLRRIGRLLRGGVVTGAADDDPSAIGTYAAAGAKFGFAFLWIAPLLLPLMYVVVYLSAKLGKAQGLGLFAIVRKRYPRWVLYPLVLGAFTGNLIEAAANLGGIGAALALLMPLPVPLLVGAVALGLLSLQLLGSYQRLRGLFRWLALALLAYVVAAILADPPWREVLRATFVPHLVFHREFLAMVVACIGTSLSAYVYTWQSNQEVEEAIAEGDPRPWRHPGVSRGELRRTRGDVLAGMVFSNLVLYFILLGTAATLHRAGHVEVQSAADAAQALQPLAGRAAGALFALGVIGVGLLAVPVMTLGAAYDVVQALGRRGSLHARPREAPLFYAVVVAVTLVAVALNLLGFNPMHALVWSGIVQGFSLPPLLLLMLLLTNDRRVMGERTNGWLTNLLGAAAVLLSAAATIALLLGGPG